MRILITGASGFIGSHITRAFLKRGYEVIACARNPESLQRQIRGVKAVYMDFARPHAIDDWLSQLNGIDSVINSVGIIRETRSQTFAQLHHQAPCSLFQACQLAGVKRIIQISALGADDTAFSQYHLSKRSADRCLMDLDIDKVILKPSLVYGPGGKSAAFFKAIAALPLQPVMAKGDQCIQPIHIDDLTQAVVNLVQPGAPANVEIEAVGPAPIQFKDMLEGYRRWLGYSTIRLISIPYPLALVAGKLAGFMGNTPLSGEAIQMLHKGNTGKVTAMEKLLGFTPRGFETALQDTAVNEGDRWHARLFFVKPLLRFSMAFLWIFTGITSAFFYSSEQSYGLLAQVGITGMLAPFALYAAALLDAGIGIAILLQYKIQLLGLIQIAVILLYTMLISLGLAELWLHPFGPITKNIPLVVAIIIMMALERE